MKKFIFDMETGDPDDVFTLCFLSTHPLVDLKGVTVTPGSKNQIGLVKHILSRVGKDIPVGSRKPDYEKNCVSVFYYNWLGKIVPIKSNSLGSEVISSILKSDPDTEIITGAPLGNLAESLNFVSSIKSVYIQGGFAGDSVVPPEHRLYKFNGRETCPTYNLGGDVPSAQKVISSHKIGSRYFISKNVCHGVIYHELRHALMKQSKSKSVGFKLMLDGMEFYLKSHPKGKAFHDPLAACVAIDKDICQFREVEMYRHRGEWGSKLASGTNTYISISYNSEKFWSMLSKLLLTI